VDLDNEDENYKVSVEEDIGKIQIKK